METLTQIIQEKKAKKIFENERVKREETMFGIEQEFFFTSPHNKLPLGMNYQLDGKIGGEFAQGPYYCGVGAGRVFGRRIAEEILKNAIYSDLKITGLNFEVAPGQCEFQLCDKGIKMCGRYEYIKIYYGKNSRGTWSRNRVASKTSKGGLEWVWVSYKL